MSDIFEGTSMQGKGRPRSPDTQRIVDLLAKTGTAWRAPAVAEKLELSIDEVSNKLAILAKYGTLTRCAIDVHLGDRAKFEYRISAAHGTPMTQGFAGHTGNLGPMSEGDRERRAMIDSRRVKATRTSDQPNAKPGHQADATPQSAQPVTASPAAAGDVARADAPALSQGEKVLQPAAADSPVDVQPPAARLLRDCPAEDPALINALLVLEQRGIPWHRLDAPPAITSSAITSPSITNPADAKPLRIGHYSDGTLILENLPNCTPLVALPPARAEELIRFIQGLPRCA